VLRSANRTTAASSEVDTRRETRAYALSNASSRTRAISRDIISRDGELEMEAYSLYLQLQPLCIAVVRQMVDQQTRVVWQQRHT